MQTTVAADHRTEFAISLMVVVMLSIPVIDVLAKILGATLSAGQIVWFRLGFQAVLLAPLMLLRPPAIARGDLGLHLARGVLMALAGVAFFWSLTALPLADAVAIFFVQPLLLSLMACVLLKEGIGRRRFAAVLLGFVGVLLVVRPGFASFGMHTLMALTAGTLFAVYLLLTRHLGGRSDAITLQFTAGLGGFVVMSGLMVMGALAGLPLFAWRAPDAEAWLLLVLMALIGTALHLVLVQAFRLASATVLAPFQYLEILGAVLWGWFVFGDWPDVVTLGGIAIIVSAGLYIFQRERRRALAPMIAARAEHPVPTADDDGR